MKKLLLNQDGQTAIEYVLLLAVLVAIITSVMGIVKDRFLGQGGCPEGDRALICRIQRMVSMDSSSNFRRFQLFR